MWVIKFQLQWLTPIIPIYFNMLVSRLSLRSPLLCSLLPHPAFCTAKVNSIHLKILSANHWDAFQGLFETHKHEITPQVIDATIKHLSTLISKDRGSGNPKLFRDLVDLIDKVDIDALNAKNITNYLGLLRYFNYKKFHLWNYSKLSQQFCQRYGNLLKQKNQSDMSDLLSGYFEMVYFKHQPNCTIIASQIADILSKDKDNRSVLSVSQLLYLIHLYSIKDGLTAKEQFNRSYALNCLADKLDGLRPRELMSLATDLKRMDILDMKREDIAVLTQVGDKVIEIQEELEEKIIYDFLKAPNINKHSTFRKIYMGFWKLVCGEIEVDGSCEMDPDTILYFFTLLSNHLDFKFSPEQQDKYYNFLKSAVHTWKEAGNTQQLKQFQKQLAYLLSRNFYDKKRVKQLTEMIQTTGITPNLFITVELYKAGADITSFLIQFLSELDTRANKFITVGQISILLSKIARDPQYKQFSEQVQVKLSEFQEKASQFYTEQSFQKQFRLNMKEHKNIDWQELHRCFGDKFKQIQNPLSNFQNFIKQVTYLEYVINSYSNSQFTEFLRENGELIKADHIRRLIDHHISTDSRQTWLFSNHLLRLVSSKINTMVADKERSSLIGVCHLLGYYCRFFVYNQLPESNAIHLQKIIHFCLNHTQILNQLKCLNQFSHVLHKYLTASNSNYSIEFSYRELLSHTLQKIQFLHRNDIYSLLINEGLRLNLITRQIASNIDLEKKNISFFNKARLQYILDNKYTPEIRQVSRNSLRVILSNHNLTSLVEQKSKQIKIFIDKISDSEISELMAIFNLKITKVTAGILYHMGLKIAEGNSNPKIDYVGIIHQMLDKGYNHMMVYRKIAEKVTELAKKRPSLYSASTHRTFIKLFVAIPGYNPTEYYQLIRNFFKNKRNLQNFDTIIKALRITNFDLPAQDLARIPAIIKNNTFNGMLVFLTFEHRFEKEKRQEIVTLLVDTLNKHSKEQKFLSELRYKYLVRNYPQIMQKLQKKPQKFVIYSVTHKPRSKILPVLHDIAKHHNITDEIQKSTLDEGTYYQIKEWAIIFINQKMSGSHNEHQFVKRAFQQQLQSQGVKSVICIGNNSPTSLINYLHNTAPELVSEELLTTLVTKFKVDKSPKEEEQQQ